MEMTLRGPSFLKNYEHQKKKVDACYGDLVSSTEGCRKAVRYWKSKPYHDGFRKGLIRPIRRSMQRNWVYEMAAMI